MFGILLPAKTVLKGIRNYLPVSYGEAWLYVKDQYGVAFLREDQMKKISSAFLRKAGDAFPPGWEREWGRIARSLISLSLKISRLDLKKLSSKELLSLYQRLFALNQKMWSISIFIDAMDAGYDYLAIQSIAQRHSLSSEEIQVLSSSPTPSYVTQWQEALWMVKKGRKSPQSVLNRFFWYRTDYADFAEMNPNFIKKEARKAKPIKFTANNGKIKAVLKRHNLPKNPLRTFQILTSWRDDRKRLNFTSIYGLFKILREAMRRQGKPVELASCLFLDEAEAAINGSSPSKSKLLKRIQKGIILHFFREDHFNIVAEGSQAKKKLKELENQLPFHTGDTLEGIIACKGIVKGRARIILTPKDLQAKRMKRGDILVTSMTRPEFLPLMAKASAIITDEGGISCHAAIVSRELGIPCIIGTKTAPPFLKMKT